MIFFSAKYGARERKSRAEQGERRTIRLLGDLTLDRDAQQPNMSDVETEQPGIEE